jgi:uncharacterized membrane protein
MDYTVPLLWIHLVAVVTWVGLWFTTVFAFNIFRQHISEAARAEFIEAFRKRYLAITWAAIAVFIVTGVVLMETDENYPGLAQFFASDWSTLVTIKHLIVIIMLITSFILLYGILPRLRAAIIKGDSASVRKLVRREKFAVVSLAVLGATVLLIIVAVTELPEPEETAAWLSFASLV